MEIILLERIQKLGQMGDVVRVKDGYARNHLLPAGKALRATEANRKRFEEQRAQLEARNLELKSEAEAVAAKLGGESFVAIRSAGETGQLYGSVSTRDIAELITGGGFSVQRSQVRLDKAIKTIGLQEVIVSLHPEVDVAVTVNVARSEDEAERQARGEDVTLETFDDDEDEGIQPEEVFEDEALAEAATEEIAEETGEDDAEAEAEAAVDEDGESKETA